MKKEATVQIEVCDNCGKADRKVFSFLTKCLSCEKEYCLGCREKVGVEFAHGVGFSGSGDGYFCNSCVINPAKHVRQLLQAYIRIKSLRQESKTMWQDFDTRKNEAEKEVKILYDKFKSK